ncbi:MAG: CDP-alcohol phosphatidyltransferase family protein [Candidatus Buchananbacteria bacterium]
MLEKINPNHLTTLRLLLTFIAIGLLLCQSFWPLALCLIVMAVCEWTDYQDGHLARKYNKVTDFGKIYDPMCDSIYHLSIFLCLIQFGLPIWVMAIFMLRDIIIVNARMYCMSNGYALAARWTGKWKAGSQAVFQLIFVIYSLLILSGNMFIVNNVAPLFFVLVVPAGIAAVFFTLYSLADYLFFVYCKFLAQS